MDGTIKGFEVKGMSHCLPMLELTDKGLRSMSTAISCIYTSLYKEDPMRRVLCPDPSSPMMGQPWLATNVVMLTMQDVLLAIWMFESTAVRKACTAKPSMRRPFGFDLSLPEQRRVKSEKLAWVEV